jgi:large subunit ribosomal protein L29
MTRAAEFYAMDAEELGHRLSEMRRELLNLRFQLATGQLDNVARIRQVRRDVARALTVLREMEIAEAEGVELRAPQPTPAQRRAREREAQERAAAASKEPTEAVDGAVDEAVDEAVEGVTEPASRAETVEVPARTEAGEGDGNVEAPAGADDIEPGGRRARPRLLRGRRTEQDAAPRSRRRSGQDLDEER